jgi:3'-phosphoadenosine 5'-phosphosulfate sulfotransferase (PAPS reductase)/FAD synthetase
MPLEVISQAVDEHKPSAVFALFSGGHDSVCALRVAVEHPQFTAAVHINTGTGIPETRDYVYDTARALGVPLLEYSPREDRTYEWYVMRFGFPGPGQHSLIYRWLKERQVERLMREHTRGPRDRIVLISGVRRQESVRRMGTAKEVQRRGGQVWVAPIIDWSAAQRLPYMEKHGITPSPVVQAIHRSGECNCGAYGSPQELEEMEFWGFKTAPTMLRDLERRVFAVKPNACRWASRPIPSISDDQPMLPLCASCPTRWEPTA